MRSKELHDSKYPSALSAIHTELVLALRNGGLDRSKVRSITETVIIRLRERFGGQQVYISKHHHNENAQRDRQIRSIYNGRNGRALCLRFGISRTRLYQILKASDS